MPYAKPSWRQWPELRWLSKSLCFIRLHDWLWSKSLGKPIACVVCGKRTIYYEQYRMKKFRDP